MADNVSIDPGSTTPIATDEIGGAHYQRVKLALGADGENDGDVSRANPVPVQQVEAEVTFLSGTSDSAGANTVVAAPGEGSRLVVVSFQLQNEVATEQTVQLHEEGTATKGVRLFAPADNAGFGTRAVLPDGARWKLAENKGLVLTLAAATAVGWSVSYYTEAV
jgi:hypothetical protein